ncbi:MAG: class I SAM-dependent methyltransferase [Planctomycetes bacterium]|nr:class I SAM-dependent methyltransferase [Planctomycetota bacterium]
MRFSPLLLLLGIEFAILSSGAHDLAAEEKVAEKAGWYMGRQIARTMSYHGADWLIRNSREREEEPQRLLDALHLKPGQQVGDYGCGNGFYAIRLAHLVGPKGKVFAVDIQQEMLDLLDARCKARGIGNVQPVLATEKDSRLQAHKLDWLLMVDVYHELSYPGEVLGEIRKSLNPHGRVALVEFREEDPTVPIKPLHKMSQAQALKELTANGFKLVGQFDGMPWQHVLFFARDDSPRPSVQLAAWNAAESEPE